VATAVRDVLHLPDKQAEVPFWLASGARILIYGTGTIGQDVHRAMTARGVQVMGFMDHLQREAASMKAANVFVPDDPRISPDTRSGAAIILAIHNREANTAALVERLRILGYQRIVPLVDVYDYFSGELGDRYWLTNRGYYQAQVSEIESGFSLLADETSRALFLATLRFRITGDPSVLPSPDPEHQYVPPDLPPWDEPMRLVDCGAYDGDTLKSLLRSGHEIQAVAAFEPDPSNFSRLRKFVEGSNLSEAYLWPCAVGSTTRLARFGGGQGEASGMAAGGESTVQTVALDDVLFGFSPNLVKLDIEGAEQEALRGARRLVASRHPGLAVCVYHRPEDLWQVPLLVRELAGHALRPPYQYFLRLHGYGTFELVLYAEPTSRGVP
jgi:FkbM family methyltransferase